MSEGRSAVLLDLVRRMGWGGFADADLCAMVDLLKECEAADCLSAIRLFYQTLSQAAYVAGLSGGGVEQGGNDGPPVLVWRFDEAPQQLREMSGLVGDEDWLALVPASMSAGSLDWADQGTAFGCCRVEEYALQDGRTVLVGFHA